MVTRHRDRRQIHVHLEVHGLRRVPSLSSELAPLDVEADQQPAHHAHEGADDAWNEIAQLHRDGVLPRIRPRDAAASHEFELFVRSNLSNVPAAVPALRKVESEAVHESDQLTVVLRLMKQEIERIHLVHRRRKRVEDGSF